MWRLIRRTWSGVQFFCVYPTTTSPENAAASLASAARLTPCVVVVAVLTACAGRYSRAHTRGVWAYEGPALLLVGCLIKGGAALEMLGRPTDIAFDETGTIRPDERPGMAMATSRESASNHPIARVGSCPIHTHCGVFRGQNEISQLLSWTLSGIASALIFYCNKGHLSD